MQQDMGRFRKAQRHDQATTFQIQLPIPARAMTSAGLLVDVCAIRSRIDSPVKTPWGDPVDRIGFSPFVRLDKGPYIYI